MEDDGVPEQVERPKRQLLVEGLRLPVEVEHQELLDEVGGHEENGGHEVQHRHGAGVEHGHPAHQVDRRIALGHVELLPGVEGVKHKL